MKRITIKKQANSQHSAMNVIKQSQVIYHNFTTRITILALWVVALEFSAVLRQS